MLNLTGDLHTGWEICYYLDAFLRAGLRAADELRFAKRPKIFTQHDVSNLPGQRTRHSQRRARVYMGQSGGQ